MLVDGITNNEDPDQTVPLGGMTTERLQQIFGCLKEGILQYIVLDTGVAKYFVSRSFFSFIIFFSN